MTRVGSGQSGRLEVYPSKRLLVRGFRWRRVVAGIDGKDVTLERSDHLYVRRSSATRGAVRGCPGIKTAPEQIR